MEMRINYLTRIWRAIQRLFSSSKGKETQQKGIAFAD
jgi:hypothetical protein